MPTQVTASLDSAANDNAAGARQAALLRQAIDQHVAATEIATGRRMTPGEHLGLSAKISEQFQPSSADLQKSAAPEGTAPNTKGILADDGENDNAKLLGKASTNGLPPDVADFNSNDIAAPTELKKLASSDDSPNLAECMAICEKLALPTYIRDGFPYWQCVQACMSGDKSGHRKKLLNTEI